MSQDNYRGVFTIPSTPFDEAGETDWEDFRRVLDFCVGCGAHGIVWPVNASSFAVLTDDERLEGTRIAVEQTAGRIPVVIGVQGLSAQHAAVFANRAQEVGADAVIAMAPYVQEIEDDAITGYFSTIASAARMPVFIQNHTRGSVLSVATLARLIREVDLVDYVKEESFPVTRMISRLIDELGSELKRLFRHRVVRAGIGGDVDGLDGRLTLLHLLHGGEDDGPSAQHLLGGVGQVNGVVLARIAHGGELDIGHTALVQRAKRSQVAPAHASTADDGNGNRHSLSSRSM